MNYDLDHIRRIQTQLAELPCGVCSRQGLVLLLRYNGQRGSCCFTAFCKTCRMKHPINLETPHRSDDQELRAKDLIA